MKSRAARLTLLILFIVSLGATTYLFWKGEALEASAAASTKTFSDTAHSTIRVVLDLRAAQQAYVAAGQAGDLWSGRAAQAMDSLKINLEALRASASTAEGAAEIEAAIGSLAELRQLDRRARDYARAGQHLIASDLIFGDGAQRNAAIDARVEKARALEAAAAEAAVDTYENRQAFALAAGAAAAALVVFLLLPGADAPPMRTPDVTTRREAAPTVRAAVPTPTVDLELEHEGWRPARPTAEPEPLPVNAEQQIAPVELPPPPVGVTEEPRPVRPHTDFAGVAKLCTDLARVDETQQLPSLLDRASALLDARGIILWIADPDGRELNPIVAHGYPAQLLNRLGTIDRDADNATAAAFRTSLLQTVAGATDANGAIAAPLVTAQGCVGVMAAEVRGAAEREESTLAAASIVAAQLATLVGPPVRTQGRVEAAGA